MIAKVIISCLISIEGIQQLTELDERHKIFAQARDYADSIDKPLLVVGCPKHSFSHPCGDVTIDIDPPAQTLCDMTIADIRDIPFPSHYFGAAFVSHVLEHLPTIGDAIQALGELHRVADRVFIVSPHKSSLMAWLNPDHYLWVIPEGDDFLIEQR